MSHGWDNNLLLNILIVVSGPLIMQLLVQDRIKRSKKLYAFVFALIMTVDQILCMSFPFNFTSEFRFDLRAVPMVLGVFYGGYGMGLFLFVTFAIYRLIIGGPMQYLAVVVFALMVGTAAMFKGKYSRASQQAKLWLAMVPMTVGIVLSDVIIHQHVRGKISIDFTLDLYSVLNFVVLFVTISIIEYTNENLKIREEVNRTEKYHVLGGLAASIAHEIRNPMTVARGFLQLTAESKDVSFQHKSYLQTALGELDRAHSIIDEYLSFAKPRVDLQEQTDVRLQIQHVVDVLRPYATLNNVIISHSVEDPLYVFCEPQKFAQVLINICKNGIEAMPTGGMLTIVASCRKARVSIDIMDTGVGMTDEELQRLGDPFYSTKANGTGLGLMTSYRIFEALNGKIEVYSERGKGTTFSLKMPFHEKRDGLLT